MVRKCLLFSILIAATFIFAFACSDSSSTNEPVEYSGEISDFTKWSAGLLFPNGVEPGIASECEAPSGNRCWYVFSSASGGGDGSFAAPFNSFEKVVGYRVGDTHVPGLIRGGDHLYVRGVFYSPAESGNSKVSNIELENSPQDRLGDAPTVIKSWKGFPRAVFDGRHQQNTVINLNRLGRRGIVIQNIEVRNAYGIGIFVGFEIDYAKIISVYVHDTKGDGRIGVGGGISLQMGSRSHNFSISHSHFVNNGFENVAGSNNNLAGVTAFGTVSNPEVSQLALHNNIFEAEENAIRHKHSGRIRTEAFHNLIVNSKRAFYLVSYQNFLHHNIVINSDIAFLSDTSSSRMGTFSEIFNNTIYNSNTLLHTTNGDREQRRFFDIHDNIFTQAQSKEHVFVLGRWGNGYFNIPDIRSNYNLYGLQRTSGFLVHQFQEYGFENGLELISDTTSLSNDPQFVNPAAGDFSPTLQSPAIGSGTDGITIGALS